MKTPRRILISPLDWGLGHASRIIPLIDKYIELGDNVIIAGSGMSLNLLRKHYPSLKAIEIPSFSMKYSKGNSQVWAVIKSFPKLLFCSFKEHRALKRIVKQENIDFIISDNRFGLFHKRVPSAYITHQLMIKLPKGFKFMEPMVAFMHRCVINNFTECWVPDFQERDKSLAGELSHPKKKTKNVKYIGILSRFSIRCSGGCSDTCLHRVKPSTRVNKLLTPNSSLLTPNCIAILSGAEPQRSIFENELLESLQKEESENIILVQGKIDAEQKITKVGKIIVYNFMNTEELRENILKADKIICRSGYSSVMDLYALGKLKNASLIPTPGQPEQEYLAEYISNNFK